MTEPAEPTLRLRGRDIAARSFDEETIILDLESSTYLAANPAGTVLWAALKQGATRADLIGALLEEFEVAEAQAAADVDAFVADCARRGLLDDGKTTPA